MLPRWLSYTFDELRGLFAESRRDGARTSWMLTSCTMTAERHTIMMRPSQRIRLPIDSKTSSVGVHHLVVRNDVRLPVATPKSRAGNVGHRLRPLCHILTKALQRKRRDSSRADAFPRVGPWPTTL